MSSDDRLNARLRTIKLWGLAFIGLTILAWLVLGMWRDAMNGLLLGELGGAYVVFSMIRQGHHNDNMEGPALFASGMLGMFTRLIVLAIVMFVSLKVPHFNPFTALIGYLFGFVFIFVGLYGYAKNQGPTPKAK
jgi:hypothetical protein